MYFTIRILIYQVSRDICTRASKNGVSLLKIDNKLLSRRELHVVSIGLESILNYKLIVNVY